jgi:hypothetical protein
MCVRHELGVWRAGDRSKGSSNRAVLDKDVLPETDGIWAIQPTGVNLR